jgi:hypothetical protein
MTSQLRSTQRRWLATSNHRWMSGAVTHVHARPGQELAIGSAVVDIDGVTLASPVIAVVTHVVVHAGELLDGASPVVGIDIAVTNGRHHVVALMYEPGMGLTLWARNDDAYDEYTSQVDPREDLRLEDDLVGQFERLEELTYIGWERALLDEGVSYQPADPNDAKWRHLTADEFSELEGIDAPALVARADAALGDGYSVVAVDVPIPRRAVRSVEYRTVPFLVLQR